MLSVNFSRSVWLITFYIRSVCNILIPSFGVSVCVCVYFPLRFFFFFFSGVGAGASEVEIVWYLPFQIVFKCIILYFSVHLLIATTLFLSAELSWFSSQKRHFDWSSREGAQIVLRRKGKLSWLLLSYHWFVNNEACMTFQLLKMSR